MNMTSKDTWGHWEGLKASVGHSSRMGIRWSGNRTHTDDRVRGAHFNMLSFLLILVFAVRTTTSSRQTIDEMTDKATTVMINFLH